MNIHIGKPKCASTFLQKYLFTATSGYFLGKRYDYKVGAKRDGFKYAIIKKILLPGGLSSLNPSLSVKLADIFREREILLSEEMIAGSLSLQVAKSLFSIFGKHYCVRKNQDLFDFGYEIGISLEPESPLASNHYVSELIGRLLSLFGHSSGSILFIDREFPEWCVSIFNQAMENRIGHIDATVKAALEEDDQMKTAFVYGIAGFLIGAENAALKNGLSFGISKQGSAVSANKLGLDFYSTSLSKDRFAFFESLKDAASAFNIPSNVLDSLYLQSPVNTSNTKRVSFIMPKKYLVQLRELVASHAMFETPDS